MSVLGSRSGSEGPIGIAWPSWSIPSKRGPAQLFRLSIGKVELGKSWICRCREFIRIGDAAEGV